MTVNLSRENWRCQKDFQITQRFDNFYHSLFLRFSPIGNKRSINKRDADVQISNKSFFLFVFTFYSFSSSKFNINTFINTFNLQKVSPFPANTCNLFGCCVARCILHFAIRRRKKNYAGDDLKWVMCKRIAAAHYIDKLVYKQAPTLRSARSR